MRNGASAFGVLYIMQYIMAWANSSCLSWYKAMREPGDGMREVENSHVFRIYRCDIDY